MVKKFFTEDITIKVWVYAALVGFILVHAVVGIFHNPV